MKRVILINPAHPYGKSQVYMNGSLIAIAARLQATGCEVNIIDFNLDSLGDQKVQSWLRSADIIGVSFTGAFDIPGVIQLLPELRARTPNAKIIFGGQVIEALTPQQFTTVFGTEAIQVRTDADLAALLNCQPHQLPRPESVSYQPVWERLGVDRLKCYLSTEGTLVVSQGCHFKCKFCAAHKGEKEVFRDLEVFTVDLSYLCRAAKQFGIRQLEFYASSLDFFQTPSVLVRYLEVLAAVQTETGVHVRVRCLSCTVSFKRASERISNFGMLLKRAGVWCVGFGADGSDASVWQAQGKTQNNESEVRECLELCKKFGLRAELLMVLGFPEDTTYTLAKTVLTSLVATARWDAIIRPYRAKRRVPGNDEWNQDGPVVQAITADPQKFYNLDFAALADADSDPEFWHRCLGNAAYLIICGLLTPVSRCTTSPTLPQGHSGLFGVIAKRVNRWLPFDR